MAKMIHSMIRVLDVERSKPFTRRRSTSRRSGTWILMIFALVYLGNGENDFEIELTLNKGQTEDYTTATVTGTSPCASMI